MKAESVYFYFSTGYITVSQSQVCVRKLVDSAACTPSQIQGLLLMTVSKGGKGINCVKHPHDDCCLMLLNDYEMMSIPKYVLMDVGLATLLPHATLIHLHNQQHLQ